MKSRLHLQFGPICLLAVLLLSDCAPQTGPVTTANPPTSEISLPVPSQPAAQLASPPAALNPTTAVASPASPQPTEASSGSLAVVEVSSCPLNTAPLYVNRLFGYCLTYPNDFSANVIDAQTTAILGPALDQNQDPLRVSLTINAQQVPEGADLSSRVEQFISQAFTAEQLPAVEKTPLVLGGEPAIVVENVPGVFSSRVLLALHGNVIYQLTFQPAGVEQADAGFNALFRQALASFTFFPVQPSPAIEMETVTYTEFGRTFTFSYDPTLAQGLEIKTVEAVRTGANLPYFATHPAFAQFRFLAYNGGRPARLPFPFVEPALAAYRVQDFSGFGPESPTGFPQQLEELRRLLDQQPDLAQLCTQTRPVGQQNTLPFLPWLNSLQVFCAQPQVVEFSGGKGIRYLTAFSQGITPLLDPEIFYTFQGFTSDGEIYFSAVFPVLSGIFPLEANTGDQGQLPGKLSADQLSALNAQPGDQFLPPLNQLDALVSSLNVTK